MAIFGNKKKPVNTVFRLPVDTSTGPKGLLRSEYIQEQNSILYPMVANMPKEEVQQFLDAGIVGPIQAQAEGITRQKQLDVYSEVIEVTALDQKTPEQAIAELETLRDENPFLKSYVSPAVIEALKQSDNPTARRAAQGKLANVLIATELLNNKLSETNTGFMSGVGDFFDVLASDLPVVSAFNVSRRKELSDRFLQLMDSTEDAAVVRTEMEAIINEAADMGFFTDSNRFYLNDFLGLTLEQGKGAELALQQGFAAIDILASLTVLGDAGKLVGFTKGVSKETIDALMFGVLKDNVAGAVDPATWKESLITSERVLPRTPAEATAVKEVEMELRATQEAINVRIAAGSAIDDDAFEAVKQDLIAKAKERAKRSGNLRYIDGNITTSKQQTSQKTVLVYGEDARNDINLTLREIFDDALAGQARGNVAGVSVTSIDFEFVDAGAKAFLNGESQAPKAATREGQILSDFGFNKAKQQAESLGYKADKLQKTTESDVYFGPTISRDAFDNITLTEYYGTTKGKAFASQTAAKIYADQILGEVVPVQGQAGQWLVKKTSNIKTGIYSQGATPDDIIADLGLYKSLDTDELGRGFFANFGSPLSQTDDTNNAVLKQGEFARAMATETLQRDVERQLKIVGKEGKDAVERVYTEIRDGQFASMREAPTIAQFDDMFFTVNGRRATEAELKLHSLKLEWNNTDWYFTADVHFKRAVERGIEILVPQDGIEIGAVKTTREANTGRLVWDIDSGSYQPIDTLNPDRQVYKLVEPMEFDGQLHDLVASATPKTRALKHTDVMGYNAGGSRLYAPNRNNFFIKQDTEYKLADGTARQGTPRTIMAVKTEKEAVKAQSEINTVIDELHRIANPKAFTKAGDYLSVIQTKYKDSNLNKLIARNSGWNTDVHGVKELVEWATENNIDLRKKVSFVSDGQPLVKGDDMIGDITFKDVAITPGPLKMGDFRKDTVLMGYGGQKLPTIAPFEAISRSLMSSVAKQTEMAYETRAIMRLFKTAVERNLLPRDNIALIRNMSLRQKARNMVIDTGTDAGKKLELERKKILSRLEKQRQLDNAYHKARESLANVLWDKGWKKASEKIDALSADPVAGTRGIVFDAYLGLGAIDQFYVQASQMINIIGMADKTIGVQASVVAPYFRKTLMNGHKGPTEVMAKLTSGILGVTPEQFISMIDTFKKSGKGFVNASVADLGEDSAGKVIARNIREKLRIAYTEGELMARVTAHIAASMEYIKKFGPTADLSSQHATRWVTHRSDVFTNGMTSTSRHPIEQFPMMQFMSFSMRMAEWYFSGMLGGKGVLDTKKKFKLFTFQLGMYGAAAIPGGGYLLDWYNRNYGVELNDSDFYQIRYGLIDNLIRYTTGVETEIGRRLAWGEGLFDTISNFQDQSMAATMLGPVGTLGTTVLDSVSKMVFNIRTGGTNMIGEDALDVFRSIKSVNMAHNAWIAFRWGIIRSRKGDILADDLPTGEAVAIALGVPLHKVNELWREAEFARKDVAWYRSKAKMISQLYQDWHFERETNGPGTKREREIISAIETANIMYQEYMPEINRYIDKKFITMAEEQTIEILKRETKRKAAE
ncbi:hypothetical protein EKK58_08175 [Candidatus Dependentiae bacterium]|nr:MAG: hypothetical protein EKK58_08175 [Candidatus Dependentiae bacterium]